MAQHIHPDVAAICDSPEDGEMVRLVIVVEEGQDREISEKIGKLDGVVDDYLPSGVLTVSISETSVPDLCDSDEIKSISPDDELRILA